MTRVVVVADSGSVMAELTSEIGAITGAHIVRHVTSRAPLDRLVARVDPDVVVIGDLQVPTDAPARLVEAHSAAPRAKIVVLPAREPSRLSAALRTVLAKPPHAARMHARRLDSTHGRGAPA